MLNRVLLSSTSMSGNLDAVPHSCTISAGGDATNEHKKSYISGFLARRATAHPNAVPWPEGTIRSHPEENVTGGDISKGECAVLAKHLTLNLGTLGLLPHACKKTVMTA